MAIEDMSLRVYLELVGGTAGARTLRWQLAKNSAERVAIIEEALDECYSRLVDQRGLSKDRSEDELTMQLANMLCMAGIEARHDQHVNGHCDLVITAKNNFMWLGEAKVHSGYSWLESGFQQLSTRYGTALPGRDHGELIIYHRQGNSLAVIEEWQNLVVAMGLQTRLVEALVPPNLSFRTVHVCPNSGCAFHVRHVIVPLRHAPIK